MKSLDVLWTESVNANREGRFDHARELALQILSVRPQDIQARLMVGIASVKLGRTGEARAILENLIVERPSVYPAHMWLALALIGEGRYDEARVHAESAIRLEPRDPETHSVLGTCLLAKGDYAGARESLERALTANPAEPTYYFSLSLALEGLSFRAEAIKALRRAVKLAPNPAWMYRLGLMETIAGNTDRAREIAARLAQTPSGSAQVEYLMGRILQEEGKTLEAEEHYRRATEIDHELEIAQTMLGMQSQARGRFDDALRAFSRSIELKPVQGASYYGVVASKRIGAEDRALVEKMELVGDRADLDLDERTMLEFALGKAYHDLGEPEKAMEHFDRANAGSAELNFAGRPFDREQFAKEVDDSIRLFTREFIAAQPDRSTSDLPIFIVGMIRSGTTLMEHILSCHPDIGSAGEVDFWATRDSQIVDYDHGLIRDTFAADIAEYLRILERAAPGRLRVTDKNPANVLSIPLIYTAFPNAKIIHMRRNPVDTFLSIYMTAIRTPPHFACDKENIVFAYRQYLRAIAHCRAILPPESLIEVDYEELVANEESTMRSVLERLGLPWNDACARPEKNPREVRTPSLWQVRQPIHTNSVGKWKVYQPWLGPFADFLEDR